MKNVTFYIRFLFLTCIIWGCSTSKVVLLPDTQYYSKQNDGTYKRQTQWIVDNHIQQDIKMVIHLGDITHDNTTAEWKVAQQAHKLLDDNDIRYTMLPGNHDNPDGGRKRDTKRYNQYFGTEHFENQNWWGHKDNNADNNYGLFSASGHDFMVVNLEFAPRKEALCWANDVIKQYPERNIIVATHCYQNRGGDHRNDCASGYDLTGNDGSTIWRELARRHNNVRMVLSGHVGGSEHRARNAAFNNSVHEILTDYQFERRNNRNHGNGWMRTLEFDVASEKVKVRTFTVLNDVNEFNRDYYPADPDDAQHQYDIDFAYNLPAYQFESTLTEFNDFTVNMESSGQQRSPVISGDRNGNYAVAWEDDSNKNQYYQVHGRGFKSDGCQRYSQQTINQQSSGQQIAPSIAMAANGKHVLCGRMTVMTMVNTRFM